MATPTMAEIAQSSAGLSFLGDDLDPTELTELLDGEPTYAIRKGDLHTYPPNRPPRVARTGSWRLNSEYEAGDQLDRQVADILKTLTSDLAIWAALVRRFEVRMFCGVWLNEEDLGQGLILSPQTLLILGQRGINLEFDIYHRTPDINDSSNSV